MARNRVQRRIISIVDYVWTERKIAEAMEVFQSMSTQSINGIDPVIARLRNQIHSRRDILTREDQTRTALIDPLLYALGWDVSDPVQVAIEPRLIDGSRPDYVMSDSKRKSPLMIVEAKKLDTNLARYDHEFQIKRYMRQMNCPLGVLTNGDMWKIYCAHQNGTVDLIKTLSVSRNKADEFAMIAAPRQRTAVDYRQKSEQWLQDEKARRTAADRQLTNEQKARHKVKLRLAKERKNREKAERWLEQERLRRRKAAQPRRRKITERVLVTIFVASLYILGPLITAILFLIL